jgi:glutathione S-transferase
MRVRITLHEKNVSFETIEEDLKNKSKELLALHPEGRVPVMIHNGQVIYESSIMVEYIDEAFSGISLFPETATLRAEIRLWTHWCNAQLGPDINRFKYEKTDHDLWAAKLQTHIQKLESALSNKQWFVGGAFSAADINLFPFIRQLVRLMPSQPLLAWVETFSLRPSFQKAMAKI